MALPSDLERCTFNFVFFLFLCSKKKNQKQTEKGIKRPWPKPRGAIFIRIIWIKTALPSDLERCIFNFSFFFLFFSKRKESRPWPKPRIAPSTGPRTRSCTSSGPVPDRFRTSSGLVPNRYWTISGPARPVYRCPGSSSDPRDAARLRGRKSQISRATWPCHQ